MIAISYRREDTAHITGRIYDRLQNAFGEDQVFMDLDSIPLGVDFRSHISEQLAGCDAVLAVVGPNWLGSRIDGSRRIDDTNDFVRMEVGLALARKIRLIPLLVDNTKMPSPENLPDDIRSFAFLTALRLDSGADFHHHINRLCSSLPKQASHAPANAMLPPPAALSSGAPPDGVGVSTPSTAAGRASPQRRWESKVFLIKAGACLTCLVVGLLLIAGSYFFQDMIFLGLFLFFGAIISLFRLRVPPHLKSQTQ